MGSRQERQEQGGFAHRLREVVQACGSVSALARTIDRSEGAVRKWLRGESEPNVTDLRSICDATATSIEWLVTGRGRRESAWEARDSAMAVLGGRERGWGPDYALLGRIFAELDQESRAAGIELPSAKCTKLAIMLHDLFRSGREIDRGMIAGLLSVAC